jgi:hypothetical protein
VLILGIIFAIGACKGNKVQVAITPPVTHPLFRESIGYGVVNVSYTLVMDKPEENGVSLGYLRHGSLIKIVERRLVKNKDSADSWVRVEGNYQGWLKESTVDIYDNEDQANTASENLSK